MFNTREVDSDPCKRPSIFFLDSLASTSATDDLVITSVYKSNGFDNCVGKKDLTKKLEEIRVHSHKLDLNVRQMQARRRQCCNVLPSSPGDKVLNIAIRECGEAELAYMLP
ncbi:hypothetical protein MKW94_009234 [Papaver nudicaule]|uniref:Uncharacterized protein n=1 Tax=Papaver nudicaule TaxID=74823 RepID=A0AA41VF45_PAPNU|nr:hypothetical protein [Papaver nudicaule]